MLGAGGEPVSEIGQQRRVTRAASEFRLSDRYRASSRAEGDTLRSSNVSNELDIRSNHLQQGLEAATAEVGAPQIAIVGTGHDAPNSGCPDSPGAHRTGLDRAIERCAR
jgi:hypothetical protein